MDAALRFLQRAPARVLLSVVALALVTGLIFALDQIAPVLSLGVLYVFAVLPVAIVGGLLYAVPVAVASMLAFNFFYLPPRLIYLAEDYRSPLTWLTILLALLSLAYRTFFPDSFSW